MVLDNSLILKKIKKLPWFFSRHAFLVILMFILIDLLIGGFLLYKYLFLVNMEIQISETVPVVFNQGIYKKVLLDWQERDASLARFSKENYKNPFKKHD